MKILKSILKSFFGPIIVIPGTAIIVIGLYLIIFCR